MSITIDPTTSIGQIRLRIFDDVVSDPLFPDATITAVFNQLERQSVKRTAAFFLETIATRQALIQKVIKNLGLMTDGAKLGTELRAQAGELRAQADIDDTFINGQPAFDWAEEVFDGFTERDRIINEIMRSLSG